MWHFYYLPVFILGLITGSFLNVCVWRTRENLSIVRGRSLCPRCRRQLGWRDNLPLLSFAFLKGKCRYCQQKISLQYPLVELGAGLLFLLIAWQHRGEEIFVTPEMVRDWLVVCFLLFIFVYDLRYREILDRATIVPALIFYLFSVAMHWQSWDNLMLAAVVGGGFFLVQYLVSKGKWVGGGDIRLGVLIGVILGWPNIIMAFLMAYIIGAIFSLILIAFKKKTLTDETPFGTYLAVATVIVMFWGNEIAEWYLGLLK